MWINHKAVVAVGAVCAGLFFGSVTHAANQTPTVTPVINGGLGFDIQLQAYDMGQTPVPTLHSFAAQSFASLATGFLGAAGAL